MKTYFELRIWENDNKDYTTLKLDTIEDIKNYINQTYIDWKRTNIKEFKYGEKVVRYTKGCDRHYLSLIEVREEEIRPEG